MKLLLFCLSFLWSFLVVGQDIKISPVENHIQLGDLVGNRDFAFGVENVLEEVVQDAGYSLNPNAPLSLTVELLYFDVIKTGVQLGAFGKNVDAYSIVARAKLYEEGKKMKFVVVKGSAKSVSTSTLIIDQGGKFSQANVSTAIKKLCEDIIVKLKL